MSRITNVKGTYDNHIPIFSQLNFTQRWLSIVFHIEFEELHNADKSIVYVSTFQYSLVNNVFIATLNNR